ncbi:MAG: PilC/PilY family type IV pilus protein [Deltaproteobacteria bacterium]|nr:PilC/PilY family type IV pilus protein [Deltaproteobacteria bacterium]
MKNKVTNNIKTFMPFLQDIFILLLFISIINIGLAYITGIQNIKSAYATDTSFLTNVNNPNVLIFLDSSGSMMWNEGVNWSNTTTGTSGYDVPESWLGGGFGFGPWAPGSNSVFSKIYNAKMAIAKIVQDPSFSNLNYAFATFDQTPSPNSGSEATKQCMYADGPSPYDGLTFTNPANAAYYPGSPGNNNLVNGEYEPDHSGAYDNGTNSAYPFATSFCDNSDNLTKWYFVSYDYSPYIEDDDNFGGLSNWRLYVPLTVSGTLNTTTSETVSSNSNNSTDPYFDPADIAGPAINYVLWNAPDYGGLTNPAGTVVSGLKAGGGTPMYSMVKNMITYFTNSLSADTATACRRNFSIIITDGEANGYKAEDTPSALYSLYTTVDTTYPIETFIVGFGFTTSTASGTSYIQQMANAGAGIDPDTYFILDTTTTTGTLTNPLQFSATAGSSSKTLVLPSSAFTSSTNGVLVGDTVSDNGNYSEECETNNNNSGVYANGNDCAVVTGIYPNTDTILLSNSLSTLDTSGSSGTVTVSGTVYLTLNYSQLINSLTTIFNQIEKQTSSFTSPVVNETSNQQYVYYANFKSLNQPLWGEGNIYLFGLNSQGQLIGPLGPAVTNGQINTSDSYWDNGNGAGGLLQSESSSSRDVLTSYLNPSTGTQQTIAINPVNTSSSNSDLDNLLNINSTTTSPDYYDTVCPGSTSVSACAADILNFVLNPDSSTDNWKLGAIFHSTPILIGPPPFPYSSSSYQAFKQEYAVTNPRNEVLYVGANDGMLHAFNAGSWDSSTNSYTYGTGAEVFGYIPPNLLPKITSWYDSSIGVGTKLNFPEFVDSTPTASDVFFSNIFNGTANSVDNSNYPLNQSSLQNSWHSVLIGGERNGGNYYYALGVTNPSSSSYPDPLWNITDSAMGNTWSKPNISYVCLPNPDYAANNGESGVCGNNPDPASPLLPPQYIKTYAAFIGGGYSSNNSLGNALYSLYVEPNPVNTGTSAAPNYTDEQILWEFNSSNDANMKYSIPSAVTPVLSQNFRMEGFYVGDLGGQMWSVNIPDGLPPYAASGKSNWDVCRLFDSNASAANPLNIFFSPSTATDTLGNLWVFFGTGNRENLNEVITSRNNEFIAINTTPFGGPLTCPASGPINESDLVNQTGVSGSTTNLTAVNSADGWYITLSPGEKVTSAPTVYDGIVYFTTFTPSSVTNACGYGTSNLYAVSYLNGGGTILSTSGVITIINNATPSSGAVQSTVIGSGVASAPVILNGHLIITTSAGGSVSMQIPALPSKVTPTSWFQEP